MEPLQISKISYLKIVDERQHHDNILENRKKELNNAEIEIKACLKLFNKLKYRTF